MNKLKTAVRNTEVDAVSDAIIRAFKADKGAQGDSFLMSAVGELETLSAKITTAIFQDNTRSGLLDADKARDGAVRTLKKVLASYAVFPIAEKRLHAAPLKAVFDKYAKSGITRTGYTSESSLIESMLEDFAAPSLAGHIAELEGVAESLASIRAAQDNFTKANDEYVKEHAHKKAAASSFNKPIVTLINSKLVPYLNVTLITGNEACIPFAKKVESEIKRANALIDRRKKKDKEEVSAC